MEMNTYLREQAIGREVFAERRRQEAKWGVQNHPSVPDFPERRRSIELGLPGEFWAKETCECRAKDGALTWGHITVEELCEAVEAKGEMARREELIQLAAVVLAWIENIDRNTEQLQEELTR